MTEPKKPRAGDMDDVRVGSKPEVQRGSRNVRCWGESGSRIPATEGPILANSRSERGVLIKLNSFIDDKEWQDKAENGTMDDMLTG